MLSAVLPSQHSYPAMLRQQPAHQRLVHPGPLVILSSVTRRIDYTFTLYAQRKWGACRIMRPADLLLRVKDTSSPGFPGSSRYRDCIRFASSRYARCSAFIQSSLGINLYRPRTVAYMIVAFTDLGKFFCSALLRSVATIY